MGSRGGPTLFRMNLSFTEFKPYRIDFLLFNQDTLYAIMKATGNNQAEFVGK